MNGRQFRQTVQAQIRPLVAVLVWKNNLSLFRSVMGQRNPMGEENASLEFLAEFRPRTRRTLLPRHHSIVTVTTTFLDKTGSVRNRQSNLVQHLETLEHGVGTVQPAVFDTRQNIASRG